MRGGALNLARLGCSCFACPSRPCAIAPFPFPPQPDAQQRFMEVKVAYEALSDSKQRAEYDRRLRMVSWAKPCPCGSMPRIAGLIREAVTLRRDGGGRDLPGSCIWEQHAQRPVSLLLSNCSSHTGWPKGNVSRHHSSLTFSP